MDNLCTCPVCLNTIVMARDVNGTGKVTCPRCGSYSITDSAEAIWKGLKKSDRQITNASSWLSEHQGFRVTLNDIEFLATIAPPSVAERADKLLLHIDKGSIKTGQPFSLPHGLPSMKEWHSISWSSDDGELDYLVRGYLMKGMNWLSPSRYDGAYEITARGYQHIEEITKKKVDSNRGFCAMWFDPSVKHVWTDGIEPAIRSSGYEPVRIDSHEHNNRIDDEIIAMIRRSKFVVADFTGQRGGVYFEAGYALGLGLQVIWTCRKDELASVHFDNRQYSFVVWEEGKLVEFKQRLQNRIEATIGTGNLV